jgi:hypothetical protein
MSEDGLFYEGNPFDDPAWKAADAKKAKKDQTFVGCPMSWLEQVLPHVRGAHQLAVALLLYRRWVLCGRRRTFDFPNGDLKKLGINHHTKSKALAGLGRAGVATVEYLPGCAVRVTRRW